MFLYFLPPLYAGKEDVKGREEGVNELRIAGQLSGGIPFDFHSDTANRANRYVGRSVSVELCILFYNEYICAMHVKCGPLRTVVRYCSCFVC